MKNSLVTPLNVLRVLTVLCIVVFFCPVFMVSCGNSEYAADITTSNLAVGSMTQETEEQTDEDWSSRLASSIASSSGIDELGAPHPILWGLLALPVFNLILLYTRNVKSNIIVIMFMDVFELISWCFFAYEVKKTAEGYMLVFRVKPWFVANIISLLTTVAICHLITKNTLYLEEDLLSRFRTNNDQDSGLPDHSSPLGRVKN